VCLRITRISFSSVHVTTLRRL